VVDELEPLREEWTLLARASRSVFATWEWASLWWKHFGRAGRLLTSIARSEDGQPLAVLPLYAWSERPFRILRFLGHGAADELGPVCAASSRPAAGAALLRAVEATRCDVLLGEQLDGDGRWREALGGVVVRREASPILRLHGASWDELLSRRSTNFREQVRRRERRLARGFDVRFRLSAEPDRLDRDLDLLFALHRARWGRRSAFRHEAFHREFAALAHAQGWLRLWFLEVDDRAVAAWCGYRFEGVESYYQAGRDPAWDPWSVGSVLLAHTIREAAVDGMQEYRFLRGDEPFKYRFADHDAGVETVAVARGAAGRAALAAARAATKLAVVKSAARRLLR
jgi:CelD/BcsL family acetyltransferase involved in cellulose biosynthesis